MATIFDVAKYILKRCGSMHPMKLQKLCYYAQAWALVVNDEPLFDEDFEAWANGPVCRELYELMKMRDEISPDELIEGDCLHLTRKQKERIDHTIRTYVEEELHYLSELVRSEEPWADARNGYKENEARFNIIPKDSIQGYYLLVVQEFK